MHMVIVIPVMSQCRTNVFSAENAFLSKIETNAKRQTKEKVSSYCIFF